MSRIRPDVLATQLEADNPPFLLDIRPQSDYEEKSLANSHNIPVYRDLQRGNDTTFRAHLSDIPANESIVVICKMGIVARRATRILSDEGYDASTLAGGMSGWTGYQNDSLGYKLRSILWKLR